MMRIVESDKIIIRMFRVVVLLLLEVLMIYADRMYVILLAEV